MKYFFFAPPTESNLRRYETWATADTQDVQFLGDSLEECACMLQDYRYSCILHCMRILRTL